MELGGLPYPRLPTRHLGERNERVSVRLDRVAVKNAKRSSLLNSMQNALKSVDKENSFTRNVSPIPVAAGAPVSIDISFEPDAQEANDQDSGSDNSLTEEEEDTVVDSPSTILDADHTKAGEQNYLLTQENNLLQDQIIGYGHERRSWAADLEANTVRMKHLSAENEALRLELSSLRHLRTTDTRKRTSKGGHNPGDCELLVAGLKYEKKKLEEWNADLEQSLATVRIEKDHMTAKVALLNARNTAVAGENKALRDDVALQSSTNDGLRTEVSRATGSLANLQAKNAQLEKDNEFLKARVEEFTAETERTRGEGEMTGARVATLDKQNAQLRSEVEVLRRKVTQHAQICSRCNNLIKEVGTLTSSRDKLAAQLQEVQEELDRAQSTNEIITRQIVTLVTSNDELKSENTKLARHNDHLNQQTDLLTQHNTQLTQHNGELAQHNVELAQHNEKLEAQVDDLAARHESHQQAQQWQHQMAVETEFSAQTQEMLSELAALRSSNAVLLADKERLARDFESVFGEKESLRKDKQGLCRENRQLTARVKHLTKMNEDLESAAGTPTLYQLELHSQNELLTAENQELKTQISRTTMEKLQMMIREAEHQQAACEREEQFIALTSRAVVAEDACHHKELENSRLELTVATLQQQIQVERLEILARNAEMSQLQEALGKFQDAVVICKSFTSPSGTRDMSLMNLTYSGPIRALLGGY